MNRSLNRIAGIIAAALVLSSPAKGQDVNKTTYKNSKTESSKRSGSKKKHRSTASISKKRAKKTQAPLDPPAFIAFRTQKVMSALKSRPVHPTATFDSVEVEASASKGPWLELVYGKNMIENNWATEMLTDKRLFYEVLCRELGQERANQIYPKTVGLREFLYKHKLLKPNGEIAVSGEKIEEALHLEFPSGFVVRPAVGVAPNETGRGLFAEPDQLIVEVLRPGNPLYQPSHLKNPVKSHILSAIASGEAVVLQENIVLAADAHKPLKNRFFSEARIHTYEGRVIEGAVPSRWVQKELLKEADISRAEAFVADVLKSLPLTLLNHQAWGIDVAVMDNGDLRIVDIITNRGRKLAWSSYLEQPRVLGAYTRHFEKYYGWKFSGVSGSLIRNNFANYLPYWGKRIEKSQGGWGKALAYLPPIP
jgi:hypothetical protein